jgi:hypothetical protein
MYVCVYICTYSTSPVSTVSPSAFLVTFCSPWSESIKGTINKFKSPVVLSRVMKSCMVLLRSAQDMIHASVQAVHLLLGGCLGHQISRQVSQCSSNPVFLIEAPK